MEALHHAQLLIWLQAIAYLTVIISVLALLVASACGLAYLLTMVFEERRTKTLLAKDIEDL